MADKRTPEHRTDQFTRLSREQMQAIDGGMKLTSKNTTRADGEIIDPFSEEFKNWESWNRCDGDCGW